MRRGLGLIRVSKDRDGLISPDLQRSAILAYTARTDITITAWREALDESGSQARSPWWRTLDQIISEVEHGDFDAVVAWKFSRAARNRLKWAVALDRIEAAGATLESATEGVDTTTSTGRFTRGMLAELAAFEAERIGEVWKEVKQHRTRQGLTGDGQHRFGYDVQAGLYVPNEHADTLRVAYEQTVGGVAMRAVTDRVSAQGGRTKYGNLYTPWDFSRVLRSGFGAGLLPSGTGWVRGSHEPVISAGLWESYLALPARTPQRRHGKHELSGLLRCAYCHRPLYAAWRQGAEPGMYWRCPRAQPECPGTYGWAPAIDRLLDTWLAELLAGADREYQKALKAQPRPRSVSKERRLLKVEESLLTIARKNTEGFYDDQTYLRLRAELTDEQRLLRKELDGPEPMPALNVVGAALSVKGAARNAALRKAGLLHVLVRNKERPKYLIVPRWRG